MNGITDIHRAENSPSYPTTPIIRGGSTETTGRLKFHNDTICIAPPHKLVLIFCVLLGISAAAIGYGLYNLLTDSGEDSLVIMLFGGCLLFTACIGLSKQRFSSLNVSGQATTIITQGLLPWQAKEASRYGLPTHIQLIRKSVGARTSTTPFLSIEINIIFNACERVHLLHCGNLEKANEIADDLSRHLNLAIVLEKDIFPT